ncbi:hypothetical protein JXL19_10430 [bacterium]|nr:hypothetical protein [bacterium]
MLAHDRLIQIEEKFGKELKSIFPLDLDGEALRLILFFRDGTNLRVTEQWDGGILGRYSYYWLTSANELKMGWDNAPHHTSLKTFPHHKHIKEKENLQPSSETYLEEVMAFIEKTRNR